MVASLLRVLAILAVSIGAAAINRQTRFPSVAWITPAAAIEKHNEAHIDLAGFRALIAEAEQGASVAVIDAREAKEFIAGHVPARIIFNVPEEQAAEHVARLMIINGYRIVLYCTSRQCDAAEKVFDVLDANGFSDMQIYPDGWKGWTDAKLPVVSGAENLPEELAILSGDSDMGGDEGADSADGVNGANDSEAEAGDAGEPKTEKDPGGGNSGGG